MRLVDTFEIRKMLASLPAPMVARDRKIKYGHTTLKRMVKLTLQLCDEIDKNHNELAEIARLRRNRRKAQIIPKTPIVNVIAGHTEACLRHNFIRGCQGGERSKCIGGCIPQAEVSK